jgi:hypothetical protein
MSARTEANKEFGHVEGCKILRVEGEDARIELLRCAPNCPHGEIVLLRPDQAERF